MNSLQAPLFFFLAALVVAYPDRAATVVAAIIAWRYFRGR
jgi:hypothetical protein